MGIMDSIEKDFTEHRPHKLEGLILMPAKILSIIILVLLTLQILLILWKKKHYKSFQYFSLFAIWIIPFVFSVYTYWINFLIVWCIFTFFSATIMLTVIQKSILKDAPRNIYLWFYIIYNTSYGLCILGYFVIGLSLCMSVLLSWMSMHLFFNVGTMIMLYGLYFGVLGRDLSELITDRIAISIGFHTESGFPARTLGRNTCAVCCSSINYAPNNEQNERIYILNCNHAFHSLCIRGWCLIGKKQTCPYCSERVNLEEIFPSPWEKPQFLYSNVLDVVKYMVLYIPVVYITVKVVVFNFE